MTGAKMVRQDFSVDFNKPLAFQVGHLGEAYQEWVHQPILSNETPRLFSNGVTELLTRNPWWAVPLVWLPVVCWFVSSSVKNGIPPNHVVPTVVAGVLLLTLLEYSIHRFLFHMRTTSYWGNTVHYIIHGCHHKHPMDSLRLVFPLHAAAILLVSLWILIKRFVPAPYSSALVGGVLLGYIMYDCTHYYLHHAKPLKGVSFQLKRYHMNHHFKNQDKGFGVTTTFWDRVFGTLPPKSAVDHSLETLFEFEY